MLGAAGASSLASGLREGILPPSPPSAGRPGAAGASDLQSGLTPSASDSRKPPWPAKHKLHLLQHSLLPQRTWRAAVGLSPRPKQGAPLEGMRPPRRRCLGLSCSGDPLFRPQPRLTGSEAHPGQVLVCNAFSSSGQRAAAPGKEPSRGCKLEARAAGPGWGALDKPLLLPTLLFAKYLWAHEAAKGA